MNMPWQISSITVGLSAVDDSDTGIRKATISQGPLSVRLEWQDIPGSPMLPGLAGKIVEALNASPVKIQLPS
jgi:hypothetical protein